MKAWWAIWLLGCTAVDSGLQAQKQALDAWERGERALNEGQAVLAARHFSEARSFQPDDPVLRIWHAEAMAAQGKWGRAVTELGEVLARHPEQHQARYYRALYLAESGDGEEAGRELAWLQSRGELDVQEVRSEIAFAPFLEQEAWAFLPSESLLVTAELPAQGAFEGTMVTARLLMESPWSTPVQVSGEFVGPVAFRSVLERDRAHGGGLFREVTYRLRVMGAGTVVQGPWAIEQEGRREVVEPVTFLAVGKDEEEDGPSVTLSARTPSMLLADMAGARVRAVGGGVDIQLSGSERVRLEPSSSEVPVRYVHESQDGTRVTVERHQGLPAGRIRVDILLGPQVVETQWVLIPVN